jgi:hypothetical protein
MWTPPSKTFAGLREALDAVPVVGTHEHYTGVVEPDGELDILRFLVTHGYHPRDLQSAAAEYAPETAELCRAVADVSQPFETRYDLFERYWRRIRHGGYARGFAAGMRLCWGLESFAKPALLELQERMRAERTQAFCDRLYAAHRLEAMILDNMNWRNPQGRSVVEGTAPLHPRCRGAVGVPRYHNGLNSKAAVERLQRHFGCALTSVEDLLEAIDGMLDRCLAQGAVCLKDQAAYQRRLDYASPSPAAAAQAWARLSMDAQRVLSDEEVRGLDDYLFHEIVRRARRRGLPLQIHTGHMVGPRNEITKANAVHMTGVFERYPDVHFDLFHGNWPYLGELLFLGKNYPNVSLDLCWVHAIDPLYSVELLKRSVMTVPQHKICGFGGDTDCVEATIGYLAQARDNIALALADLVDLGHLDRDEALELARAWLYENPRRIFGLEASAT